jgi:hypothetical protein
VRCAEWMCRSRVDVPEQGGCAGAGWMCRSGVDKISLNCPESGECARSSPLSGPGHTHPSDSSGLSAILSTGAVNRARAPGLIARTSRGARSRVQKPCRARVSRFPSYGKETAGFQNEYPSRNGKAGSGQLVRIVGLFGARAPDDDLVFLDGDLDGTVPGPVFGVDGVVLDGGIEP